MRRKTVLILGLAASLSCAAPGQAQILGGGGLPSLPGPGALPPVQAPRMAPPRVERPPIKRPRVETPRPPEVSLPPLPGEVDAATGPVTEVVAGSLDTVADLADAPLGEVRRLAAERLLRDHSDVVEPDDLGRPVVRGEVLALAPSRATLARLKQAGFQVRRAETLAGLGVETVVLAPPRGVSAAEAVRRLRSLDPGGGYDFNHLYQEGGAASAAVTAAAPVTQGSGRALRVGLVDGSAAPLPGVRLVQKAFAPGGARATPHATAVASLIAGSGRVRGSAPGATLIVADVYGPTAAGGSAEAIARALAWMAQARVPVVNVSLVGPPNLLLGAAVRALLQRGHIVVAAVGNDGPAAAPLYPAAYPGVVAVTGVDAVRRVLPEAGRGAHVDFAAPGGQMAAAGPGGGVLAVRGTSFAAPLAAGRLARLLPAPDRAAAARAIETLGREAIDLGAKGPDPIYGRGLVAADLRTDPGGARAVALRGP